MGDRSASTHSTAAAPHLSKRASTPCSTGRAQRVSHAGPLRALRGGRQRVEARILGPADRPSARRQEVAGYGAPEKGTRCSTSVASALTSWSTRSIGTRTSRGCIRPEPEFRFIPPSASRRRDRTTSSCCHGTSSTRSRRNSGDVRSGEPSSSSRFRVHGDRARRGSSARLSCRTSCMKVVIFCGGMGVRMGEATNGSRSP